MRPRRPPLPQLLSQCVGLLMLGAGTATVALAADEPDAAAERQQIQQRRAEIDADYARRAEQCRKEFVVTPCLEKAKASQQDALRNLREREVQIDDAARRERAQRQEERVQQKRDRQAQAADAAASAAALAASMPVSEAASAAAPDSAASQAAKESGVSREPKAPPADRSAQEQKSRERFEARQREIQEHREAVEKRNAQRKGKPPKPLPVPGAGSASAF